MRFRLALGYLACGLLGLIIGFFAGREYLKYELRSAFNASVGAIKKDLAALNGNITTAPVATTKSTAKQTTLNLPPSTPTPKEQAPIVVALIGKGFKASDPEANDFEDDITLVLLVKNVSGRGIRAFDGVAHFTDLLGNEIMPMKLAINEPIAAGSTLTWNGMVRYNQFLGPDQRLRSAEKQNLKLDFMVTKVLFADGTTKEYNGH